MKIALIHDWLLVNAGSEKVVKELLALFDGKDVEVYTLFNKLSPFDKRDILKNSVMHYSWLQYFPGIEKYFKVLLPILPFFARQLNPGLKDFYFSSSHAVAKGFKVQAGIPHVCYCHTPMRYAWYQHEDYLKNYNLVQQLLLRFFIQFIRKWDLKTSNQVDHFIANSIHIQSQIKQIYGQDSKVIYPPVQIDKFVLNANPRKDFYLAVGRFVSYKKMDIVVKAFMSMPDKKLVLIGDGSDAKDIQKLIEGHSNIVWLGYQHEDELILYMQNAKACIFAAKEDFGITCVEAQATGTPVIALNYGGYKETVLDGETGYFFENQEMEDIKEIVEKFDKNPLTNFSKIRENTYRFSRERFKSEIANYLKELNLYSE